MMEEMLYKFIDEGNREQEEMRAFINEFRTTNELLFKERNNSLSELRFEVHELLRVIDNAPISNYEVKKVTTRGLEKSINQSNLEGCGSLGNKSDDDSDLEIPIRRIDYFNTPYSVTQQTTRLDGVLEKSKGVITWKMSNIKGISPSFYMHKILMEDDLKPVIQLQRRLNPKVQEAVKNEIVKLLDSGLIYPTSDSSWVNPIHVVLKKGGMNITN
ncbi:hypothetical protein Tco_0327496 [Tanacetum coccineum]